MKMNIVEDSQKESGDATFAKSYIDPVIGAAYAGFSLHRARIDLKTVVEEMRVYDEKIKRGDLNRIESFLLAQSQLLNMIFNRMVVLGSGSDQVDVMRNFFEIALKAQNQSRKTLSALADLKNPQSPTFVKQQNVAVNQQVNNAAQVEDSKKFLNSANEQLSETIHEKLDIGRTTETIQINPKLEAMAEVNWSKNTNRKGS